MSKIIATFFYVGHLKPAPGTWGSLAALLVAQPALSGLQPFWLIIMASIAFGAGLWATARETGPHDHDPSHIVIDEAAGQWVALVPLAYILHTYGHAPFVQFYGSILAFGFFRLFDILKPWPVSWADRREDALGVMLDDILAGVMAAFMAWALSFGAVYVLTHNVDFSGLSF